MSIEDKEVIINKLRDEFGGDWYYDEMWLCYKCREKGTKVTEDQLDTKKVIL